MASHLRAPSRSSGGEALSWNGAALSDLLQSTADSAETRPVEISPSKRFLRYPTLLGRGACKRVFKAFDIIEGIEVAWNQVEMQGLDTENETRERLFSEIHTLQALRHKSIMSFFDWWYTPENETINFITEAFSSGNLRQYRKRMRTNISEGVIKRWAWQILQGLLYMHGHDPPIVHRDLKCDNIFINGSTGQVKIGDLGLATAQQGLSVVGTPEFMAPEIYEEQYDEKVDIYSYGMCLLELATLEYPYSECHGVAQIYRKVTTGVKPKALERVDSPELRQLIEQCIAHDAADRPDARHLLKHPFFDSLRMAGSLTHASASSGQLSNAPSGAFPSSTGGTSSYMTLSLRPGSTMSLPRGSASHLAYSPATQPLAPHCSYVAGAERTTEDDALARVWGSAGVPEQEPGNRSMYPVLEESASMMNRQRSDADQLTHPKGSPRHLATVMSQGSRSSQSSPGRQSPGPMRLGSAILDSTQEDPRSGVKQLHSHALDAMDEAFISDLSQAQLGLPAMPGLTVRARLTPGNLSPFSQPSSATRAASAAAAAGGEDFRAVVREVSNLSAVSGGDASPTGSLLSERLRAASGQQRVPLPVPNVSRRERRDSGCNASDIGQGNLQLPVAPQLRAMAKRMNPGRSPSDYVASTISMGVLSRANLNMISHPNADLAAEDSMNAVPVLPLSLSTGRQGVWADCAQDIAGWAEGHPLMDLPEEEMDAEDIESEASSIEVIIPLDALQFEASQGNHDDACALERQQLEILAEKESRAAGSPDQDGAIPPELREWQVHDEEAEGEAEQPVQLQQSGTSQTPSAAGRSAYLIDRLGESPPGNYGILSPGHPQPPSTLVRPLSQQGGSAAPHAAMEATRISTAPDLSRSSTNSSFCMGGSRPRSLLPRRSSASVTHSRHSSTVRSLGADGNLHIMPTLDSTAGDDDVLSALRPMPRGRQDFLLLPPLPGFPPPRLMTSSASGTYREPSMPSPGSLPSGPNSNSYNSYGSHGYSGYGPGSTLLGPPSGLVAPAGVRSGMAGSTSGTLSSTHSELVESGASVVLAHGGAAIPLLALSQLSVRRPLRSSTSRIGQSNSGNLRPALAAGPAAASPRHPSSTSSGLTPLEQALQSSDEGQGLAQGPAQGEGQAAGQELDQPGTPTGKVEDSSPVECPAAAPVAGVIVRVKRPKGQVGTAGLSGEVHSGANALTALQLATEALCLDRRKSL